MQHSFLLKLRSILLFAASGIVLGASAIPASAQSLKLTLTSLTTSAAKGDVVTFTLNMVGSGSQLYGYSTYVLVDPALLQFVPTNTNPNNPTAAFVNANNSPFADENINSIQDSITQTPGLNGNDLAVSYQIHNLNAPVTTSGTLVLGTFQAKVLTDLGTAGADLTLAPVGDNTVTNNSQIIDLNANNMLTDVASFHISAASTSAVPAPSALFTMLLGGMGGVSVLLRNRRQLRQQG